MQEDLGNALRRGRASLVAGLTAAARWAAGVGLADAARRRSDWHGAIKRYEAYTQFFPNDYGVWIRLARTLVSSGRLEDAERLLDAISRSRPDKQEVQFLIAELQTARDASTALADYDQFRRNLTIPSAPVSPVRGGSSGIATTVVVDGRGRTTAVVSLSLESLRTSLVPVARVVVWISQTDPSFSETGCTVVRDAADLRREMGNVDQILMLEAGVIIHPEALGWLQNTMEITKAVAVYADDDQSRTVDDGEIIWSEPSLHAGPHRMEIATVPRLPTIVLFRCAEHAAQIEISKRKCLLAAFDAGTVSHVPLLLSTTRDHPPTSRISDFVKPASADPSDQRLIVAIIPTRDEASALRVMIDSLIAKAAASDRLQILVVDNGSRDSRTHRLLKTVVREGRGRVLAVDEPFNWARLNNLAAAVSDEDILLFANNDMKMLTSDWDVWLRSYLSNPEVGIVGARLVYPDGGIQHGGMALGAMSGKPVHEGLGAAAQDGGPLDRWQRVRPAAAVTGAFLAVRADVFRQTGGFDADHFAIGCNDIDFCLRVRGLGLTVLYAGHIELVHWESRSRGHDDTGEKLLRARREMQFLDEIWGVDARQDPSRNPHWRNHETALFFGLRQPDRQAIEAWITSTCRSVPQRLPERSPGSAIGDDPESSIEI